MAESDIPRGATEDSGIEEDRDVEWVVAKSLLDANAHCTRALEQFLLQTLWSDNPSNLESVGESVQRAIEEHEKSIEHLELAAEAVSELRDDETT